ncbi:MAG: hypothetical protein ACLQU4_18400 [Limisphaerales bacterium]
MNDLLKIAALLLGAVLGLYCGVTVLIPAAGIFLFVLMTKWIPIPHLKPFVGALAIQFGHGLSMFIAGLYYLDSGGMRLVMFDLLVLAIGLTWLMSRPGLMPVLLLGIYQLVALVINIHRISDYEVGSVFHKAITVTIALRLAAIIALVVGYRQFSKNETEAIKHESEKAATDE